MSNLMDLISNDAIGAFGLLLAEACEQLVDSHPETLDKRAAMLAVSTPSFSRAEQSLRFLFKIQGNRQRTVDVVLEFSPTHESRVSSDSSELALSLESKPQCSCDEFANEHCCSHTLAASWWLQEQLGRRSIADVLEFFGELQVDEVSAGREFVDGLLSLAKDMHKQDPAEQDSRIQWRVSISERRYYSPLVISAYEQRPRKNGKGWTKGRAIHNYDLLRRDFTTHPVDGRIAALVADRTYAIDSEIYGEVKAIDAMVGHPNVAWNDADATPVQVISAELTLRLDCVSDSRDEPASGSLEGEATSDVANETDDGVRYRPTIRAGDMAVDLVNSYVFVEYISPVEPIVLIADEQSNRIVVCPIRNPRAASIVEHLLSSDLDETLLDAESAAKLSLGSAVVEPLMRVELPPELAGPIEPVAAELVLELRPRPGAGLHVSLAMHDDRFRELLVPGEPPSPVACITEQGPVRLQRNLSAEQNLATEAAKTFALDRLSSDGPFRWVAESDDVALELLGRLHAAGDSAPRMLWPEGESLRVRGEIAPSALKVQIDDRRDWFGLQGAVTIDGKEVPLSDLLAAVREDRSLVKVGDREFAKISDSFRQRLQQLGDAVVSDRGSLRVADAVVPTVQELIGSDVTLEATARWHDAIARLEEVRNWVPSQPDQLDAKLRDYQLEGYQWLARLSRWGVGGVLADDMGLGKTVQGLGVLIDRGPSGPALVVAPTSVGENWVRETRRFAPGLNARLYRDEDRDALIGSVGANDLVIVSYQLLQRDVARFASREWHTLVLDEAQFIKNAQTKTSQAVRRIDADWRIGLSGTPLENHLGELWSLFRTISPGMLGSWERFRNRFADPIERYKDDARRQSLARLVRPFILRRTKDKVLKELPPRTEITLNAELGAAERRIYEQTRMTALTELSGINTAQPGQQRIRTLAWLTRLRQLACHPKLVDKTWRKGSAKLDLLMSLLDELREGEHRALVFSQFVKHLNVVREQLDQAEIEYQYLDGSTPAKERQRRVDAFQDGEGDLFLISLKAGGTGLNLTGADYVIHLDPWWNPAVEDQATDRAHRIGQDRPVTVYRLVAEGTIEEQILQLHADKRELVAGVLDGTDRAAKMNTEDLIALIREGALS